VLTSINQIKVDIGSEKTLTLDAAILGEAQRQCFAQIFPLPRPQVFTLFGCEIKSSTHGALIIHGTFAQLFPRKNVEADVCLFDSGTARHAVVRIPVPQNADAAFAYLSQYSVDEGDLVDPEKEAPTTSLGEYIENVTFSSTKSMIFSTFDYTADENARSSYPFAGPEEFPVEHVRKGLNFAADISLDKEDGDLDEFVGARLVPTGLDFEPPPYWCLVHAYDGSSVEQRPVFRFTRPIKNATLPIVDQKLVLSLEDMSIVLELARPLGGRRGPQILVDGTVKVSSNTLSVTAAFDYYYSQLSLLFRGCPTLGELLSQFNLGLDGLPDALLSIQLSRLMMLVDLDPTSVSAISFELTTKTDIDLIKGVISLKPTLAMQIDDPFDAELRSFEGSLKGDWTFEDVKFETEVGYPGLWFYAGMKKGEEASTKKLADRLFPGVNLPELTFKNMWIEGSIKERSLSATIEAEVREATGTTWGFRAPPEISLWCALECPPAGEGQPPPAGEGQPKKSIVLSACSVEFNLPLAGVNIFLSGEYVDGQDGLQFDGSTGPGQKIKIGELINDLAGKFNADTTPVPDAIKTLVFTNLALSFNTSKQKSFRFTGEARLEIEGTPCEISLTVELADKDANGKYQKRFAGTLKAGGVQFQLKVEAGKGGAELLATWEKSPGALELDLGALGSSPELSYVKDLLTPPKEANLTLNLGENNKVKRLAIDLTLDNGAKAELRLAQDPAAKEPSWIVALGLQPTKITTRNMSQGLGALGKMLDPYDITLNDLLVVVANADSPKDQKLTLAGNPVTKGFLLKGVLEFGGTSFRKPFECRLGEDKPKALPGPSTGGSPAPVSTVPSVAPASPPAVSSTNGEVKEANNNVPVGRTIGPVTFRKARLESRGERVYLLLDASLGSGGLALDLTGFNVNFPLKDIRNPATLVANIGVGLDGLSIAYSNPPLTISGGLIRTDGTLPYKGPVFRGHLLIKAETFQITVLGCYGNIEVGTDKKLTPSLFLYGVYAGMLGGPPPFYVTGLALGGGYNSRMLLPKVEEVAEFPLVKAVTDPASFATSPNDAITKITEKIVPSPGDYWLAIGVKFDSFKMADSFALFSVSFGTRLQFALLGLTKLTLPQGAKRDEAALYAELAIRAVLDPDAGVFSIEGRLTQSSYVLSKQLHLTGGFAFFVWFGNSTEAGDFVISLGGYHHDFPPPAHYPVVPRVGIRGQIDRLTVVGEAYLAITPSCVMAGQRLEAVFETDVIVVAFVAYADFLIAWAPFHYDARIGIGISVALQELRSFKLEVFASLHIWGPPFAGIAEVMLATLSFAVEFGDQSKAKPDPLEWDQFQKAFLPSPDSNGNGGGLSTIRITEGLVREVKREKEKVAYRIVNPYELMIETDSVVPCSEVGLAGLDLRLMSLLNDVSRIPTSGKNLIIVAAVNNVLHFRFFDGDGKVVVDTDEKSLSEQAWQIKKLREQLKSLWPPHELTWSDKERVITAVTSIVGHTRLAGVTSQRSAARIGIRPMAATALKSSHLVSIKRNGVGVEPRFKPVQWSRKNYPEALWSDKAATGKPDAGMIKDVPSGVVLRVGPTEPTCRLGPFLIEKFQYEEIKPKKKIPWSLAAQVPTPITKEALSEVLARRLRDDKPRRNHIRDCLVNCWNGPELQLVSWGDGSKVPISGNNLVIVGTDSGGLLHIRIFDAAGNRVTDADQSQLPITQAAAISALKQQIPGLLPPHVLTDAEKARVITQATSIAGDTRWNEFALTKTSEKPFEYFQAPPTCAALGQSL